MACVLRLAILSSCLWMACPASSVYDALQELDQKHLDLHQQVLSRRCPSMLTRLAEFAASLSSLGKVAWVRLDNDHVRFTIIPEKGTQVWA